MWHGRPAREFGAGPNRSAGTLARHAPGLHFGPGKNTAGKSARAPTEPAGNRRAWSDGSVWHGRLARVSGKPTGGTPVPRGMGVPPMSGKI